MAIDQYLLIWESKNYHVTLNDSDNDEVDDGGDGNDENSPSSSI